MDAALRDVLAELSAAAAELVQRGLVLGSGGNVSLRVESIVHISPKGMRLDELAPDRFVSLDLASSETVGDSGYLPSSETPTHRAAYAARPQTRCIIHTHSRYAVAYAYGHLSLPAGSPEVLAYIGREIPVAPWRPPSTDALGEVVGAALRRSPAVFMRKHGLIVCGDTVQEALLRTLLANEAANIALLAGDSFEPMQPEEIAQVEALQYGH